MKPSRPKRTRQRARVRRTLSLPSLLSDQRVQLEEKLGYTFKDKTLLDRAVTHPGAVPGEGANASYERLEFLGDRVLGLVIASILYDRFDTEPEGGLAPRLNAMVNREQCAEVAKHLGLDRLLLTDPAEKQQIGDRVLANACEAVLGAVFLEAGYKTAAGVVERLWQRDLKAVSKRPKDPKTVLQEWAQSEGHDVPTYQIIGRVGPDHAPEFAACVYVGEFSPVEGRGATKQDAQRAAAQRLLEEQGVSYL